MTWILLVNCVIHVDMLDLHGDVVWASGDMPRQLWLNVKANTRAEAALEVKICAVRPDVPAAQRMLRRTLISGLARRD